MSKRPAFQFYPSDWRNDPGLRLCSIGARGLWMDMMCLMHEGQPYGHLTVMGRHMPPEALARLVGEGAAPVKRWLKELGENEVYSTTEDGVIFSRMMIAWRRKGHAARRQLSAPMRRNIYKRDGLVCSYCGTDQAPFHIDHIVPVSRGGESNPENLTVACVPCNRSKGVKLVSEWRR